MSSFPIPSSNNTNSISHDAYYNSNYDIVWSFDFALSGSSDSEGSFTTFLYDCSTLSGGAPSIGGAYTPLTGSSFYNGVSGAILGINFDTTGLFALSSQSRDVDGILDTYKNSISIRSGESTNYSLLTSVALSSLDTEFYLLSSENDFQRLRFRLTDVGQTIRIDYRYGYNDYQELFSYPVNLTVDNETSYKVGLGYTSPISGEGSNECKFTIRNFHIEGNSDTPDNVILESKENDFVQYPLSGFNFTTAPTAAITTVELDPITIYDCPITIEPAVSGIPCFSNYIDTSGSDILEIPSFYAVGSFTNVITAAPVIPPVVLPPSRATRTFNCSQQVTERTNQIPADLAITTFPYIDIIDLTSSTDPVRFDYNFINLGGKIEIYYDGSKVVDTGYVLNDLQSQEPNLRTALQTLSQVDAVSGVVTDNVSGTFTFDKTTSSPTSAEVKIYAPLSGTYYEYTVFCPALSCGNVVTGGRTADPNGIGIEAYTSNRRIIDLGTDTGTVNFSFSAFDLPDRYQVYYDGVKVVDTGWVGSNSAKFKNILANFLTNTLGTSAAAATIGTATDTHSFSKTSASPRTAEVVVTSPFYNTEWRYELSCPGAAYSPSYIPASQVPDHTETFP